MGLSLPSLDNRVEILHTVKDVRYVLGFQNMY